MQLFKGLKCYQKVAQKLKQCSTLSAYQNQLMYLNTKSTNAETLSPESMAQGKCSPLSFYISDSNVQPHLENIKLKNLYNQYFKNQQVTFILNVNIVKDQLKTKEVLPNCHVFQKNNSTSPAGTIIQNYRKSCPVVPKLEIAILHSA